MSACQCSPPRPPAYTPPNPAYERYLAEKRREAERRGRRP